MSLGGDFNQENGRFLPGNALSEYEFPSNMYKHTWVVATPVKIRICLAALRTDVGGLCRGTSKELGRGKGQSGGPRGCTFSCAHRVLCPR